MGAAMIGTSAGALLAMFEFFLLQAVAEKTEKDAADSHKPVPQSAALLRVMAWANLILMPVVGYFVGPMVLNG